MSRILSHDVIDVYCMDVDSPHDQTVQSITKLVHCAIEKMAKRLKARGKRALGKRIMRERTGFD